MDAILASLHLKNIDLWSLTLVGQKTGPKCKVENCKAKLWCLLRVWPKRYYMQLLYMTKLWLIFVFPN